MSLFLLALGAAMPLSAQTPDTPPAKSDAATVYFYRLRDGYAAMLKPSVFLDQKAVARIRNGRFVSLSFPAGQHTVTSTFPGNGLTLELKPGETYYVRLGMTHATLLHNARGEVSQVPENQGKFEVAKLKPAEPEDLHPGGDSAKPDAE